MSASLLYFALLGLLGYAIEWVLPQFGTYLVMLPCLPVLYWAVITERYLVASGLSRHVIVTNLTIGVSAMSTIFFIQGLKPAEVFYALGFSAYLLFLQIKCRPDFRFSVVFWAAIISPVAIWVREFSLIWGIFYMCSLVVIAAGVLGLRPSSLRDLRFS